jgi:uncharacterized protein (TIGR03435 family)
MKRAGAGFSRPLLLLLVVATAAGAQTPAFEVASIKPNTSGLPQMMFRTPPSGALAAINVTTRFLIRFAYNITENRIVELPDWATREHFDIVAKAPPDTPIAEVRLMYRALLADRFALRAHTGSREMPVDVLTVDGTRTDRPGLAAVRMPCDRRNPQCGVHLAFGSITAADATLADVATALTVSTGRVVIDRTGLTEHYELKLTYTPDALALQPSLRTEFPTVDPDGPSLATALKEQFGIRMQSTREPVDVLVVDSITHPSVD